jgi:hypothetical protein
VVTAMNIHPMDMQVLIPRTTDVGKTQQLANQQVLTDQQVFGEQLKERVEQREHQVQHLPQAEGGKITLNQDKNKQQPRKDSQNSMKQETTQDEQDCEVVLNRASTSDPVRGRSIDISM